MEGGAFVSGGALQAIDGCPVCKCPVGQQGGRLGVNINGDINIWVSTGASTMGGLTRGSLAGMSRMGGLAGGLMIGTASEVLLAASP